MNVFSRSPFRAGLFALAAFSLVGCTSNASISNDTPATSASNETENTANVATNDATTDNTTTNDATANDATANTAAANTAKSPSSASKVDTRYRISTVPPNFPQEVVAALKKLQVAPPLTATKVPDVARVRLATSKGDIEVQLSGKAAPLHVKSFLHLSGRGFYNGTRFHRYEPGFVIQGGDPISKLPEFGAPYASVTGSPSGFYGMGGPGYEVPREQNSLKHDTMVLAAARSSDPDSAGSQFYFTLEAAPFLDEGDGYTVFGKVLKGKDVVLKLRANDVLKQVVVLSPKS